MNQDTRAINKLNCPNAEWFTSARDGVDKHHDPNVWCTQPDGTGRHVAPACVCSVFLASTSRTTVFLQKRRRHVRHSQINRPLLERPFTASFIWLLLYEPITPGHQHPLHCCGGSFNLQTSLRLLFLTRNKMSSIIWCPKSISGLLLSPACTACGSTFSVRFYLHHGTNHWHHIRRINTCCCQWSRNNFLFRHNRFFPIKCIRNQWPMIVLCLLIN